MPSTSTRFRKGNTRVSLNEPNEPRKKKPEEVAEIKAALESVVKSIPPNQDPQVRKEVEAHNQRVLQMILKELDDD